MTARRLTVLAVGAAVLVAGSGGSGHADPPPHSATPTTPTPPTATTPTTAAKTTTSTTKTTATVAPGPGPTQGFGSARAAIDHFVAAWQAGDKAGAQTGASPIAVH